MTDPTAPRGNPAIVRARRVLAALSAAGVRHVCVSPGARSAPLAIALAEHPGLTRTVHHDERAAGFFALGLARHTRTPVALVCTSGSAVANWFPAVVEASESRIPLVLLSADRPPEHQGCGAGQAIDQTRIFGGFVRHFVDLGTPSADEDPRWAESVVHDAVTRAVTTPAGPVHLNLPFREPLVPDGGEDPWEPPAAGRGEIAPRQAAVSDEDVGAVEALLRAFPRGVLVAGPADWSEDDREAILELGLMSGWPIVAESVGGLRAASDDGPLVLQTADAWLRIPALASRLRPDAILQLGPAPTSKAVRAWMDAAADVPLVVLDPDGLRAVPSRRPARFLPVPVAACVERLGWMTEAEDPSRVSWRSLWSRPETLTLAAIRQSVREGSAPPEGWIAERLARVLQPGDRLHLASSMPIRDFDAFGIDVAPGVRITSNRGANGIDGMISTAFGIAWGARGAEGHTFLHVGDVAAIHDLGSLVLRGLSGIRLTIVLVNNDGGGIFGFLPVGRLGAVSEELFGTPHGVGFEGVASSFGIPWTSVEPSALATALQETRGYAGVSIVEVRTDRQANVAAWAAFRARLAAELDGGAGA